MTSDTWKRALPTVAAYLEKRRKAAQNQLPRHLRALPRWPVNVQILLNLGLITLLCWLMWNRDEFMSEATPALGLVVCLLLFIYSLITAFKLRNRYQKTPIYRRAKINVWLMAVVGLLFPASVAFFLP